MFRQLITIQFVLIIFQGLAGGVIGATVADESIRRNLVLAVSAPFVVVNLWLLLQNWLIYIYDVGIWGDRIRASAALAFLVSAGVFSFTSLSDVTLDGNLERPVMPRPLTEEQLAADKLYLLAEDKYETDFQNAQHRNDDKSP